MEIYLEFRIKTITPEGIIQGLEKEDTLNSIRWKRKPLNYNVHELEGSQYNIFLEGVYTDSDPDINLKTLIVRAEYQLDPTITFTMQIGGFTPRNGIEDIPLHITTEMNKNTASLFLIPYGIDGMAPMEGGIRAQENDYDHYLGGPLIATAILENNVVNELYEYIEPFCTKYPPTP